MLSVVYGLLIFDLFELWLCRALHICPAPNAEANDEGATID